MREHISCVKSRAEGEEDVGERTFGHLLRYRGSGSTWALVLETYWIEINISSSDCKGNSHHRHSQSWF